MPCWLRNLWCASSGSLFVAASLLAQAPQPSPRAFQPAKDDPTLPRVLLIGDSISIGYHGEVCQALAGKANVHRPPTNCGPTTNGLKHLAAWLAAPAGKPWDVIHFNWGLHDLKYMDNRGTLVDVAKGKQQVPPDQYAKNLAELVRRLKQTDATLIWCATTPVPPGAQGRIPGDEVKYNALAEQVMRAEGVAINDLHSFAHSRLAVWQRPKDVHFHAAGSHALGQEVARHILAALAP